MTMKGPVRLIATQAETAPDAVEIQRLAAPFGTPVSAHFCADHGALFTYVLPSAGREGAMRPASGGSDTYDLSLVSHISGPAQGQAAPCHYVVWTDADPGWEQELDDWYDREHLAGLASVPGTVAARRYLCAGGDAPRSFACYDLLASDVMGSPAWLAIRGTEWSSRVRPHFTNTRRMMFTTIFDTRRADPA